MAPGICYDKLKKEYKDTPVKIYGKYDGLKMIVERYIEIQISYIVLTILV